MSRLPTRGETGFGFSRSQIEIRVLKLELAMSSRRSTVELEDARRSSLRVNPSKGS